VSDFVDVETYEQLLVADSDTKSVAYDENQQPFAEPMNKRTANFQTPKFLRKNRPVKQEKMNELSMKLLEIIESPDDEDALFGKSVAIFLKRPDGRNKRLARIEIEQLMLKYEDS
jgi:hypothetical protein